MCTHLFCKCSFNFSSEKRIYTRTDLCVSNILQHVNTDSTQPLNKMLVITPAHSLSLTEPSPLAVSRRRGNREEARERMTWRHFNLLLPQRRDERALPHCASAVHTPRRSARLRPPDICAIVWACARRRSYRLPGTFPRPRHQFALFWVWVVVVRYWRWIIDHLRKGYLNIFGWLVLPAEYYLEHKCSGKKLCCCIRTLF